MHRYGRMVLVVMGWLGLFIIIEVVMWPLGVLLLGSYTWATLTMEVLLSALITLITVFLPVFWAVGTGIIALYTATMEVLDREHQ